MFNVEILFMNILSMSTIASIVFLLILIARKCLKNKVSFKKLSLLWIVFIIVLIFPINFSSRLSIKNYIPDNKTITIDMSKTYDFGNSNFDDENVNDVVQYDVNNKISYIRTISLIWILIAVGSTLKDIILYNTFLFSKIHKEVPNYISEKLEQCKNKLGITKNIKLVIQNKIKTPSLHGLFNPKILLTDEVLVLSDEEMECIFMHELNHYKKHHNIFYLILSFIERIYWFNPIIHFAGKLIRQDLEFITDDLVVESGVEVKQYLKTIVKVASLSNLNLYSMPSICTSKEEIERRIVQMKERKIDSKYAFACIAIVIVLISIVTISLASNKIDEGINNDYIVFNYSGEAGSKENLEINDNERTESVTQLNELHMKSGNESLEINKDTREEEFTKNNELTIESKSELMGMNDEERKELLTKLDELSKESDNAKTSNEQVEIVLPLKNIKVSEPFGKRVHPVTGREILHSGIDLVAEKGDDVMAVMDGTVTFAEYVSDTGLTVKIEHKDGSTSAYAHGSEILVDVGDEVKAGDKIMLVGSTGMATGPHLHFEMTNKDGEYIDVNQLVK